MSSSEGVVLPPTHPGVILREEFLEPLGITEQRLAADLGVPEEQVSAIIRGQCGIPPRTGVALSRHFGMSEGFWTGMQDDYDREIATGA